MYQRLFTGSIALCELNMVIQLSFQLKLPLLRSCALGLIELLHEISLGRCSIPHTPRQGCIRTHWVLVILTCAPRFAARR